MYAFLVILRRLGTKYSVDMKKLTPIFSEIPRFVWKILGCSCSSYRSSQVLNQTDVKIVCYFLQILEDKVEYWMTKYDSDVEQKQHELDVLKVYPP